MSGLEREELIKRLIRWGYLSNRKIINAFMRVPRHEFVTVKIRDCAYEDHPLPIGWDQTISAPSMVAVMMESLGLEAGQRVLEIGSGSGYNAALIAEVVGRKGEVISIERIRELALSAEKNLKQTGYGRVKIVVSDGSLGYEIGEPWDRILVTACAPEIPKPLVKHLKIGGKLGIPIGQHYMFQTWTIVEKWKNNEITTAEHGSCSFVPLVGKYGWESKS